jgi:hypothetical protein
VQYTRLDDVKKIEGFPFSDVQLSSAEFEAPPPPPVFYVKDSLEDVTLYDTKIISLDGVFEVLNDPWAYMEISIEWTNTGLLDVVYDAKTNRILLVRKSEQSGESVVTVSASHQLQTLQNSFIVDLVEPDTGTFIPVKTSLARIYPNPATYNLYINIEDYDFTVYLYNILGQKVLKISNQKVLNVSGLKRGIYLLEINASDCSELQKLQIN